MKRILVAEDDKFLSNAYKIKLSKAGFEVKLASNGEEAVKEVLEFKPDLILLDLVMPGKDGFFVLEELNKSNTKIPVIIASNLGQQEDIKKGLSLGAKDYFVKSEVQLEDIIRKINKILTPPVVH